MGQSRPRKPYTGFGKALKSLMWDRDVRSWTQLEGMIQRTTGEKYSHQSMSKYASGATPPPPEFVQAFTRTLKLTAVERANLAEQFTYHSLPEENEHRNSA